MGRWGDMQGALIRPSGTFSRKREKEQRATLPLEAPLPLAG